MGRRQSNSQLNRCALQILFFEACISLFMVYLCFFVTYNEISSGSASNGSGGGEQKDQVEEKCCRGIEHLELWGDAVKWGSDSMVDKDICADEDRPCLCDSWVFCGDKQACGSRFGYCWIGDRIWDSSCKAFI